jgi:zinc-finger of transposase IS204/IS1001/IS1096/IS1165
VVSGGVIDSVINMLLPHLNDVTVERVEAAGPGLRIWAQTATPGALCPGCSQLTSRVHSRYRRTLEDATVAGRSVSLRLLVRRFRCPVPACEVSTFAEQIPGLTWKYARRSPVAKTALEAIAVALAGRPGSRLATALGLSASRSALLRLLRALSAGISSPWPCSATSPHCQTTAARYRTCYSPSLTSASCTATVGSGRRTNTWRICAFCSGGIAKTPDSRRTSTTCGPRTLISRGCGPSTRSRKPGTGRICYTTRSWAN